MLMKLVASSQFLGRVIGESVVKKANVPDPLKANYKPLIASLKDAHGVSTTTVKDLAQHVVSK